jgi:ribosomal protein S12 methylthiotransferase accessory factor
MTNPYERALEGVDVVEFPIHGIDRLGIPVWTAACWTPKGVLCNGVGYGATDDEARRSAWGELWESWCVHRHVRAAPLVRAAYADVADRAIDPLTLCLPAGSPYDPDRELAWIEAVDGRLLPVEWVASRPADLPEGIDPADCLITPITNGLGAHEDLERAARHGLRELQQRDGNSVAYRALDRGRVIDLDEPGDELGALLARFADAGVRPVVKLADPVPGAFSVYAVAHDDRPPHGLSLAACGEAADPDPRRAIRKALLELASSRSRRIFNHAPFAAFRHVLPAGYEDRVRAAPLPAEEGRALRATLRWVTLDHETLRREIAPILAVRETVALSALGDPPPDEPATADPVVVALSPPDAPMAAAKVVAPGLEVETMSYGRLGARNLERLVRAGERFAGRGAPPPGALPVRGADGWLHPGRLAERVGPLYALYREPGRHSAALVAEREGLVAA